MEEYQLIENYNSVKARAAAACERAGRKPEEVTIVAVSKTKPLLMIEELAARGVRDFGENYVQELTAKADELAEKMGAADPAASAADHPVNWHFIGHLQTNKVRQVITRAKMIHSVDSVHLAQAISKEAEKRGIENVDVLIEINIGKEVTKSGIPEEEAEDLLRQIVTLPHLTVRGLMSIAPFVDDPEDNRPHFKRLEILRKRLQALDLPNAPMMELSMGMTGDFEVAIEEGATLVRVGTAIFGARDYTI
ncbi:MAG: YggS family pyridoxal phosphate-dependent enzyme [Lachnospiraceae bacterium]|nr:YggS family pyridoxal phosphate-dependent enzyme [Lachnospiraceae bacterium]